MSIDSLPVATVRLPTDASNLHTPTDVDNRLTPAPLELVTASPETSRALREILSTDLRCRRRWQRHARRSAHTTLHQAGVATVLALHLWEIGEVPESQRTLPRRLKDRVSRALTGRGVSSTTLQLVVDAFDLTPEQERALFLAWELDHGGAPG